MRDDAGQWQSRTMDHPAVEVYQSVGDQHVTLTFDIPPRAPGAALGSVFVRLSTGEVAGLREKLYRLGLRP